MCPNSAFEKWYSELESILNLTLGRRLAHAAAESEEVRWSHAPPLPKSWFKQQSKRMSIINRDWDLRGIGQLAILELSDDEQKIIVANRANSPISAGMANASWELIQEQRFRFQWSDRGAGETVIQIERDSRSIPAPSKSVANWTDVETEVIETERLTDRARHEEKGVWCVEGNRSSIIQRDLILRFEALSLPYLTKQPRIADSRTDWGGVDDKETLVFWDGVAEASRRQFLASGELALIADSEHWIGVSKQHLSKQGLGVITSANSIDENGGVKLHLRAVFHPAITTGRLLGCWERSEGRHGKALWKSDENGHEITIRTLREIA
jgi:hypothetical protein